MTYTTIISVESLHSNIKNKNWAIVDCRFSLDEPEKGREEYHDAHIPGAVYAHLDEDLAAPVVPGKTGRHPLPEIKKFSKKLSDWGIGNHTQVVVYDNRGGAIASRLWILLKWLGHDLVAVLDGGWPQWNKRSLPVEQKKPGRKSKSFVPLVREEFLINLQGVMAISEDRRYILADSRSNERYRGIIEPIDKVAGHIPGAISFPFTENLNPDGTFIPMAALHERFGTLLDDLPPDNAIFYCGSGVTAALNMVAMSHAGYGLGRIFVGSWSEWINNPDRAIVTGG